jgi:hypothetical protein
MNRRIKVAEYTVTYSSLGMYYITKEKHKYLLKDGSLGVCMEAGDPRLDGWCHTLEEAKRRCFKYSKYDRKWIGGGYYEG